jgi:hypothetical protein
MLRKTCFGPVPAPALVRHLGLLVPIADTPDMKMLRERFKQMIDDWGSRRQQAEKNISRLPPRTADPRWSQRATEFAAEAHLIGLRLLAGQVFHVDPPSTSSEALRAWCSLQLQAIELIDATDEVHFCMVGNGLLWDRDVLELYQNLSANPPSPDLTTDTPLVDVSWLKDTDEEEYEYWVHQYLSWGDLPASLTSEYQELVDDAWSAMRSLGSDEDTPMPTQPVDVLDARACKNALDQLRNWCLGNSVTVEHDGPEDFDRFRLHGKTYEGFTNLPYRLLCCLWDKEKAKPKPAVSFDDVLESVYWAEADEKDGALRNVINRLRKELRKTGCPAEVKIRSACVRLIVDFKND